MTGSFEDFLEKKRWLTPLILGLLTLAFFWRVFLTPGGVFVGGDFLHLFYPIPTFVVNEVRAGTLPLWNPHLYTGVSLIADPEIAIYYPPNWLLLALGVARGETLLLVVHVWWAGWGMAKLARSLGASALGGLLGGLIYGFSGWLIAQVWAGHYTLATVACWLPWVLASYQHALRRGAWRATLPGMAAFGLTVLAGYPPLMIHLGLLLLALATLHVLERADRRGALLLAVRQFMLILIGGAMLASVQLIPVAEFTRLSTRGVGADVAFAGSFPLPGAQLPTLIFPNLLGSPPQPESYWGSPFYEELVGFAGLWALMAFLLALRLREGAARLLVAVATLGAVLSLGLHGGLLIVLVRWLPPFRMFRVPGRYLYLAVFALAALSGLVLTRLQRMGPGERREWLRPAWRVWGPCGAALAFGGAGALWIGARFTPPDMHAERLLAMAESMTASGIMLLLVSGSLWLWKTRLGTNLAALATLAVVLVDLGRVSLPLVNVEAGEPPSPLWEEIAASVPSHDPTFRVMVLDDFWEQNAASVSGHYGLSGYESLEPDVYNRFLELSEAPTAPNNRLLGVGYVVTGQPYEELGLEGGEALEHVSEGEHHIYRVEGGLRTFLPSEFEVEPDDDAAHARLMADDFDPARTVILDEEPGCPVSGTGGAATLSHYSPNRVSVEIEADGPGLLVLTDQWYPGWEAQVDGQPAELLRADTIFRAVCVPEGEHSVTFDFRPASWRWGALISLVSWGTLGVVAVLPSLRRAILERPNSRKRTSYGQPS